MKRTVVKPASPKQIAKEESKEDSKLSLQDKMNIKSIFEMMEGSENSKSKQFVEKLYIKNAKDYDATLNMFLTGDIPEDERTEL